MAFKEYTGLDLSKVAKGVLKDWDSNKSFKNNVKNDDTIFRKQKW